MKSKIEEMAEEYCLKEWTDGDGGNTPYDLAHIGFIAGARPLLAEIDSVLDRYTDGDLIKDDIKSLFEAKESECKKS